LLCANSISSWSWCLKIKSAGSYGI